MNILFVIDKIELKYFEFNNLVTNFWLIKEFLERGNNVSITTINNLYLYYGCWGQGIYGFKTHSEALKFAIKKTKKE